MCRAHLRDCLLFAQQCVRCLQHDPHSGVLARTAPILLGSEVSACSVDLNRLPSTHRVPFRTRRIVRVAFPCVRHCSSGSNPSAARSRFSWFRINPSLALLTASTILFSLHASHRLHVHQRAVLRAVEAASGLSVPTTSHSYTTTDDRTERLCRKCAANDSIRRITWPPTQLSANERSKREHDEHLVARDCSSLHRCCCCFSVWLDAERKPVRQRCSRSKSEGYFNSRAMKNSRRHNCSSSTRVHSS